MRFYRLEKKNYFKIFGMATIKAVAYSLLLTMIIMLISGYQFVIVSSGSMEPNLPVGSMVIITPCEYEDLELGDIVTMNAGGVYLTHRIIGKYDANKLTDRGYLLPEDDAKYDNAYSNEYWWITKGDNSDTLDGRLTKEIIGKVYEQHAFTWMGEVVRYVKANYVMIIALAVIMFAFIEVLSYLKNKLIEDDVECYEDEE